MWIKETKILWHLLRLLFIKTYRFTLAITFRRVMGANCGNKTYGRYATLNSAKTACVEDLDCAAITDESCDDKGPYSVCPYQTYMPNIDGSSSCIYEKKNGTGKTKNTSFPRYYFLSSKNIPLECIYTICAIYTI